MGKKIRNPKSFADAFGIKPERLKNLGVFNPVLNADTKLFIDPLLLSASAHSEINTGAVATYTKHFQRLVSLLAGSRKEGDIGWRTAERLLTFPELRGTSLGYGIGTAGSAWGPEVRNRVLLAAKETVEFGVTDPDLFLVIALLEDKIGPDLISDMTTNVVLKDLGIFTKRICKSLGVKTNPFIFPDATEVEFPINPVIKDPVLPVILVPLDILRELPVARSWDEVGDVAAKNSLLRARVNRLIGEIWEAKVRKDKKEQIRSQIYGSKEAFEATLELLKKVPKEPYDSAKDPEGHHAWVRLLQSAAVDNPLKLTLPKTATIDDVSKVVAQIVQHFRELVEHKGLWKELWTKEKRRPEKSVQLIFFAIADAHCRANNLDITPEADSGSGPVDFKISSSYTNRVLVEVKLSTNPKVVAGFESQLETYKKAERTTRATYLLIDVGNMGNKHKRIVAIRDAALRRGDPVSEIVLVDGQRQVSASKRK